jgi:hypothetical protein
MLLVNGKDESRDGRELTRISLRKEMTGHLRSLGSFLSSTGIKILCPSISEMCLVCEMSVSELEIL